MRACLLTLDAMHSKCLHSTVRLRRWWTRAATQQWSAGSTRCALLSDQAIPSAISSIVCAYMHDRRKILQDTSRYSIAHSTYLLGKANPHPDLALPWRGFELLATPQGGGVQQGDARDRPCLAHSQDGAVGAARDACYCLQSMRK